MKPALRALALSALAAVAFAACDSGLDAANANQMPDTEISNVPVSDDTLFALVTVNWDGGDPDGFVDAYEYRYVTRSLVTGDSTVREWTRTDETSVTLAFSSPEALNQQRFEVRSIDNNGDLDPTPAVRRFYTTQSFAPEVTISSPSAGGEFFALPQATDWYEGVRLTFSGRDRDGTVAEYGWAVGDAAYTFTTDTTLVVPPTAFPQPEGRHTIRVIARDDTDLPSEPATVEVNLVRPTFDRALLIIDETNEALFNAAVGATDAGVDAFYGRLFDGGDTWDYRQQGPPPRSVLGRYRRIVWHADHRPTSTPHALATTQTGLVQDYLNVGGSIVMSGWRVLKSFAWQQNFPQTFEDGTFVKDYLQIGTVDETPLPGDMRVATGVGGFPDVRVDSLKMNYFPTNGALNYVNVVQSRGGFTEIIAAYEPRQGTRYPQYRGAPVGLIYYGTAFDAGVLGFPLYLMREEDARPFVQTLMQRMDAAASGTAGLRRRPAAF